jgi:hypothetical protein
MQVSHTSVNTSPRVIAVTSQEFPQLILWTLITHRSSWHVVAAQRDKGHGSLRQLELINDAGTPARCCNALDLSTNMRLSIVLTLWTCWHAHICEWKCSLAVLFPALRLSARTPSPMRWEKPLTARPGFGPGNVGLMPWDALIKILGVKG